MAQQQRQAFCGRCGEYRLHTRNSYDVPHVFHLLVTILSCGFWIFVWFLHVLLNVGGSGSFLCTVCGEPERPGLRPPRQRMVTRAEALEVTWEDPAPMLPAPQSQQLADHHRKLAIDRAAREKAANAGHLAEIRRGRRRRLRVAILGRDDERWPIFAVAGAGVVVGAITYLLATALVR